MLIIEVSRHQLNGYGSGWILKLPFSFKIEYFKVREAYIDWQDYKLLQRVDLEYPTRTVQRLDERMFSLLIKD